MTWTRRGLILPRASSGEGSEVVGDPCIVWDDDINSWRMILFFSPPGAGEAVCTNPDDPGPGSWRVVGPLKFANPSALSGGGTHKPFVVMDALRPNRAARVDGRYWLVTVSFKNGSKVVQRAWALKLAGPWTVEEGILIDVGGPGEFDEKHVDAVTGFWFEDRGEFLYFYMGYPRTAQPRTVSPYGNASAAAVQKLGERTARKLLESPGSPVDAHEGVINPYQNRLRPIVWKFLTDTNGWFVGIAKRGVVMGKRQEPEMNMFIDQRNGAFEAVYDERYGGTVEDYRSWVASDISTAA